MFKNWFVIILVIGAGFTLSAQSNRPDSSSNNKKPEVSDVLDDFDDFSLDDLEAFLDSILAPRSYFLGSVQVARGFYNFESKSSYLLETQKKLTYTPVLGYFHKSGWGINASGYIINEGEKLNLFQGAFGPSYDFLQNKDLATGVAYTRYVTKDSLSFYTSPLKNELYGYFTYRKWWFKPSVSLSYGWGSRSDYYDREDQINSLRLRRYGFTRINTTESIKDLSVMASVRHDFYWLNVLGRKDHIRITPQILFTSGTQKFGFNQTSNTYATTIKTGANILFNSENSALTDQTEFRPLSLAFLLRTEYTFGKFFIQPQLIMDYYFPATENNFSTVFTVNVGFMF